LLTYRHVLVLLLSILLDTEYNTRHAFHLPATQPFPTTPDLDQEPSVTGKHPLLATLGA